MCLSKTHDNRQTEELFGGAPGGDAVGYTVPSNMKTTGQRYPTNLRANASDRCGDSHPLVKPNDFSQFMARLETCSDWAAM